MSDRENWRQVALETNMYHVALQGKCHCINRKINITNILRAVETEDKECLTEKTGGKSR
ncbi:hypothetical protein J6590_048427 [Homalodisca vitripennis]|nr:hypothetical protein J6590_048427 [Homalodisca vitripennis]